jgi:hypothetical protein
MLRVSEPQINLRSGFQPCYMRLDIAEHRHVNSLTVGNDTRTKRHPIEIA